MVGLRVALLIICHYIKGDVCNTAAHLADFEPSNRLSLLVVPNATLLLVADFLSFLFFEAAGEIFFVLAVFLPLLLVEESDLWGLSPAP